MIAPIHAPLQSPLSPPPVPVGAPPGPPELFAAGERGIWLDVNDLSTVFSDLAGTVPAVVGGPVGQVKDKSPNGNNAVAPGLANRPILRQDAGGFHYLEFVTADTKWLKVDPIAMAATADAQLWFAGGKTAAPQGMVCEFSETGQPWVSPGAFRLLCNYPDAARADWLLHGAGNYDDMDYAEGATPSVVSIAMALAAATPAARSIIRVDGAPVVANVTNAGDAGGTFGNWSLTIGARFGGVNPLTGRLYALILRGVATPLATVEAWETYLMGQMQ